MIYFIILFLVKDLGNVEWKKVESLGTLSILFIYLLIGLFVCLFGFFVYLFFFCFIYLFMLFSQ